MEKEDTTFAWAKFQLRNIIQLQENDQRFDQQQSKIIHPEA